MSSRDRRQRPETLFALAILLASCGGEGGSPQPDAIVVVPGPAPTPPPVATPTPTPAPSPTPTGPRIAGVAPGGTLAGPLACATGTLSFSMESDGSRRLTGVSGLTNVKIADNEQAIAYPMADTYEIDVNGFGGPNSLRMRSGPALRELTTISVRVPTSSKSTATRRATRSNAQRSGALALSIRSASIRPDHRPQTSWWMAATPSTASSTDLS